MLLAGSGWLTWFGTLLPAGSPLRVEQLAQDLLLLSQGQRAEADHARLQERGPESHDRLFPFLFINSKDGEIGLSAGPEPEGRFQREPITGFGGHINRDFLS